MLTGSTGATATSQLGNAITLAGTLGMRRLGVPVGTLFLNVMPVSGIAARALLGSGVTGRGGCSCPV
jgi:hypothetical protein